MRRRGRARAETFRKIILAMTNDIRVILIKLADRLHNLRTLPSSARGAKRIAPKRSTSTPRSPTASGSPGSRPSSRTSPSATSSPRNTSRSRPSSSRAAEAGGRPRGPSGRSSRRMMKANGSRSRSRPGSSGRTASTGQDDGQKIPFNQVYDFLAVRIITDSVEAATPRSGTIHSGAGRPSPSASAISSPCPSPTATSPCTRRSSPGARSGGDPDPHPRHARARPERGRRALEVQGRGPADLVHEDGGRMAAEMASCSSRREPQGVPEAPEDQPHPEEVYVFTPKGQVVSLPTGASAPRLRLPHPLRDRPAQRFGPDQRQGGSAQDRAEDRRHRRDRHPARPGTEPELARRRLHGRRAAADQAGPPPSGEVEERGPRPQALGQRPPPPRSRGRRAPGRGPHRPGCGARPGSASTGPTISMRRPGSAG